MRPWEVESLSLMDLVVIMDEIKQREKEDSELTFATEEEFKRWAQQQR